MLVLDLSLLKDCVSKIALELLILFIYYYCIYFYYSIIRKEYLLIEKHLINKERSHGIVREKKSKRAHSILIKKLHFREESISHQSKNLICL